MRERETFLADARSVTSSASVVSPAMDPIDGEHDLTLAAL